MMFQKKGVYVLFCLIFVSIFLQQCKKEKSGELQNDNLQKELKIKDSLFQDSIKKAKEIKFSAYIFPKKSKDSAMEVFLTQYNENERNIILALNRLDNKNRWRADTLVIPNKISEDFLLYSPFPSKIDTLSSVKKIAFFSYKIHAYALYENGILKKWGPTSMGKKETPTKTGLKFTNWKKEVAISTSNSEWKLRWNFNVHNTLGIGWHQYDLPGFHASHSCMRLLEEDAKEMYSWGEQWILTNQGRTVLAKGTPVIIFGETDFKTKPWLQLLQNSRANDFSIQELNALVEPYLEEILKEQENRALVLAEREKAANSSP